jgi:hypothetical protein
MVICSALSPGWLLLPGIVRRLLFAADLHDDDVESIKDEVYVSYAYKNCNNSLKM